MNLTIDNKEIEKSFDGIAKDLLTRFALFVNDKEIRFTEIEFYYFLKDCHEDNYTHVHLRNEGEWRFHNQGLDITLHSNEESDGGILIRGVLDDQEYINGPRNVVRKIFECFNKVTDNNQLVLKPTTDRPVRIVRTFRHLPNKKIDPDFYNKYYRYLVDLDAINLSISLKNTIRKNSELL